MNSRKKNIVLATYLAMYHYRIIRAKANKKRIRRWYRRPLNQDKLEHCYFRKYFQKMKSMDEEQFFKHTRMSKQLYDMLLTIIRESITKPKQRINADERLSITLLYLAHSSSIQQIAWSYRLGKSTVRLIVLETCDAIWSCLSPLYLSEPTQSQYENIARDFEGTWNFPNCVGAIDGKHVAIKCPSKTGSMYFNYKKIFSIVLMGVCDARYTFTAISVGSYGSESDGGIFRVSPFGMALLNDQLPLPLDAPLRNCISAEPLPYVFVADAAFPLGCRIMKPIAPRRNEGVLQLKEKFSIIDCRELGALLKTPLVYLLPDGAFCELHWSSCQKTQKRLYLLV